MPNGYVLGTVFIASFTIGAAFGFWLGAAMGLV